jgi:hypothetical protein
MPMMLKTRLPLPLILQLHQHQRQNLHKMQLEYGIILVQKDAPEELEQLLHVQNVVEL